MNRAAVLIAFLASLAASPALASPDLAGTSSAADAPGDAPRMGAGGEEDEDVHDFPLPPARAREDISPYRNPRGTMSFNAVAGAAVGGGGGTRFVIGGGFGYAVVTGILPGARALLIAGDGVGAEFAATLTLTPPIATSITPFVVGEAGRRFDSAGQAWLYGGGGGIYIGEPQARFGFQLGWIFRRLVYPDPPSGVGSVDASGPIISISLRF